MMLKGSQDASVGPLREALTVCAVSGTSGLLRITGDPGGTPDRDPHVVAVPAGAPLGTADRRARRGPAWRPAGPGTRRDPGPARQPGLASGAGPGPGTLPSTVSRSCSA